MARSKEHAIQMWKDGDWNFDNYESDYGEYNEVIDDVEEEVFADTQLSLEGVLVMRIDMNLTKQMMKHTN